VRAPTRSTSGFASRSSTATAWTRSGASAPDGRGPDDLSRAGGRHLEREGPIRIDRENQARRVSITANISGRDLGSVVREIKGRLAGFEKGLPPGYFLEYGGSYEQMQEAFLILPEPSPWPPCSSTWSWLPIRALRPPLHHHVHRAPGDHRRHHRPPRYRPDLSLAVLVGVILLMGIAVNNGIVMIDYINQLIKRASTNAKPSSWVRRRA